MALIKPAGAAELVGLRCIRAAVSMAPCNGGRNPYIKKRKQERAIFRKI
jgi:hypothetical protein